MGIIDKLFFKNQKDIQVNQPSTPPETNNPIEKAIKKLLIVVADEILKSQYMQHIPNDKFVVHSVGNGAEGLNALLTFRPDMLILDFDLPIMDGQTMLHHMRALPEYETTPVVVVSDSGDMETMRHVTVYDKANAFLIKSSVTPKQTIETLLNLT